MYIYVYMGVNNAVYFDYIEKKIDNKVIQTEGFI